MEKVRVPITVDPVKSSGKQLSYDGVVPAGSLTRLAELLLEPCKDIDVKLNFDVDEQGLKYVKGQADVDVVVACERCNEAMNLQVHADFIYAPITKRQRADEMPTEYEAVELDELGEINLHRMVEDELILALPVVIKHDEKDCSIDSNAMSWGKIDDSPEPSDNPFAVLQELKRK